MDPPSMRRSTVNPRGEVSNQNRSALDGRPRPESQTKPSLSGTIASANICTAI
jgi:hypothetical protein